jgi:CHASE2 domain-containing sensor protein/predicted Ser/Thr protein kinase
VNRTWQDFLARGAPTLTASGDVVVVAVDEDVISRLGPWPWDRGQTARLFGTIASLHPKVVGFDGYFPHREIATPGDLLLDSTMRAIGDSGISLVLPFFVENVAASDSALSNATLPPVLASSAFQLLRDKPVLERSGLGRGTGVVFSDTLYQRHSSPAGFINNPADMEDGICRHMIHAVRVGPEYLPSFAVALVAAYGDATLADVSLEPGLIQIRRTEILVDGAGRSPVRYLGRTPAIPTIPAGDLLDNPSKYAAALRGKIVLVGLTAPGGVNAESGDVLRSPLDQRCPGVELWATAVENILHNEVPRTTTLMRLWELLLGMSGCAGLWWLLGRRGPDGRVLAVTAVALVAVLVVQALIDRIATIQSGVDLPLLGLFLGWTGVRVFRPPVAKHPATTLEEPETIAGQATLPGIVSTGPGASMAPPQSGAMVGHFAIHGELGRGAMGVVLKGKDEGLGRFVAIKVLSAVRRLGEHQDENLSRFQREARAIAQLNHPSIVTIYEYGEWDGSSFIAMELLDGPSLDKVLLDHRLPWKAVRAWGMQLLEALAYAHSHGVVHRDIKPANIMAVDHGRRVKLTDFGLALSSDSSLTQEGQILGTPYYMAPELIDGKKGDAQTDQYALGVVIYEMLSRRRPFEGDEVRQIMLQILMHPVPSIAGLVGSDVPAEALVCIDRMLAKKPEDRYQGLEEALEAWKRLQS